MQLLRNSIKLLLFGNIYVSLGTFFLIISTSFEAGSGSPNWLYACLGFFATLFVYNFQRIFYHPAAASQHSVRRAWISRHNSLLRILAGIGLAGSSILSLLLPWKIFLYLSPLLLLSLAYFIPGIKLRKHPLLKLMTLVITWTLVTSLIPNLLAPASISTQHLAYLAALRFFFMAGICLPFDLRDMEIDQQENIMTLPQLLGARTVSALAVLCMLLYLTGIAAGMYAGYWKQNMGILWLTSATINTLLVAGSFETRGEYYFVAIIDGTMLLQGCFLMASVLIP